ncbi:MAG: aminotransferase class III-fold pyridoxal phosphate-dependent enzyme, partial [Moraxella sp.]|nr:aminotransferase class III-fold pyridoxal phosphate-dependent enzyme [Moraxella sp.]
MLDEVQTGNGRTGKLFAFQHSNIKPDVLTTAKGLGNGFPVGACLVSGKANDLFGAGSHGSTYGGTPLACRVVHTVYELLDKDVLANAATQGEFIRSSLLECHAHKGMSARGRGMMIGLALPDEIDTSTLVATARDTHHLIINVTGGNVIRLLPTLNIRHDDAIQIVERLDALLTTLL